MRWGRTCCARSCRRKGELFCTTSRSQPRGCNRRSDPLARFLSAWRSCLHFPIRGCLRGRGGFFWRNLARETVAVPGRLRSSHVRLDIHHFFWCQEGFQGHRVYSLRPGHMIKCLRARAKVDGGGCTVIEPAKSSLIQQTHRDLRRLRSQI